MLILIRLKDREKILEVDENFTHLLNTEEYDLVNNDSEVICKADSKCIVYIDGEEVLLLDTRQYKFIVERRCLRRLFKWKQK